RDPERFRRAPFIRGFLQLETGGGHADQSFQVLLEKPKGADDAGSSGTQTKKKIPRGRKGKKATTEEATVDEEKVPSEDTVGATA
ncbi:hypothetical protein Dimus_020761, partial [Dionaea muscipula]